MTQINKNNLSNDSSPYLQQHKNNPVNWQTWSKISLDLQRKIKNQYYLVLDMQVVIGVMLWHTKVLKITKLLN